MKSDTMWDFAMILEQIKMKFATIHKEKPAQELVASWITQEIRIMNLYFGAPAAAKTLLV